MQKNLILNALFFGFVRLVWAAGISALILFCHTGKAKIFHQILSFRIFMPLAKLGLSIYLLHPVMQYNIQIPRETISNFQPLYIVQSYFNDLMLTMPVAIVLYLLVEEPFTLLGKIISNRISDIKSTKDFILLFHKKINKVIQTC